MASRKPIKIVYAISSLVNEGPTRILLNLVRNLDRERFVPQIVTFRPERENSLIGEFAAAETPVTLVGGDARGLISGTMERIGAFKRLLDASEADIVHAHCPRSLFTMVASRPRRAKSVYTLHVFPEQQYRIIHGPVKGPLIIAASNAVLRFVDRPIACSESVKDEYFVQKGRCFPAVNNGIEPIDLQGQPQRDQILQSFGLDPRGYYLLFVGRLSGEKRIVELVKAFDKAGVPDVGLIVVGDGPDMPVLRQIAGGKVHLMGFHSDIRPFLAASDCYISPSSTEGLANSLLEAMSAGLPGLLSEIPSHRFVIDRCQGFVATVFDPLSPQSLAWSLAAVREYEAEQVRYNVRSNFENMFHSRVMAYGYENHYVELVHGTD
ncbi:glycosyltransferase family 4 protein [Novosphingobium pituita]|uniref:Glycosyltransferase family 4 protein n=1 Tax=Novosphingobium pituita TaxID=3056842 RepID=A0ABQ6PAL1_9SPHN|nr:glycosyltransferase family 4 protein [Novosphingobium sp. IK01]GMM61925.1 glycosyltransferase family 4 protein [Novosphingobium sp. IK01]